MNQKAYPEILDDAAREAIPDDLNLLPRIAAQYQQQKGYSMKPYRKFALAGALVLAVILAVVVFTVPPVAAAMRHALGYLPGMGIVEQDAQLYVLSEPASAERDGVRYIVEKASSDTQRTILLVTVTGVTPMGPSETPCQDSAPRLRLSDGKTLGVGEASGYGSDNGYTQRLVFPALPAGTRQITLEVPCLITAAKGQAPENWQIPLKFVAADLSQLAPVIELPPAPTGSSNNPATEGGKPADPGKTQAAQAQEPGADTPGAKASPAEPTYGITLALDKVVPLDNGYILMGSMSWTDARIGDYGVNPMNLMVYDADNQPVPSEQIAPDSSPAQGSKQSFFSLKVPGKQHAWPLTIKTAALVLMPAEGSFTLDLSSPPKAGETRELNLNLKVNEYTVRVLSYSVEQDPQNNATITFNMEADSAISSLMLADAANPILGGGGGGGGGGGSGEPEPARHTFSSSFTYNGALPAGQAKIIPTAVNLFIEGGWTVTWKP